MSKKIGYSEPMDYIPKSVRKELKIGEYDETKTATKKKTVKKNKKGKGLDLDEIQEMNVMNNIIDYMNNINETLKEIKKSLSNQNSQSKQNPPQKLGRFKVEKYNPNMSITEFKKLFNTQP